MTDRMYYSREAEEKAHRDKLMLASLVGAIAMAIGGFIGAAITMKLTPSPGNKTLNKIGEQVDRLVAQGQHAVNTVRDGVKDNLPSIN